MLEHLHAVDAMAWTHLAKTEVISQKVGCEETHLWLLLCKEYGGNRASLSGEDDTSLCVGNSMSVVHVHMHIRCRNGFSSISTNPPAELRVTIWVAAVGWCKRTGT